MYMSYPLLILLYLSMAFDTEDLKILIHHLEIWVGRSETVLEGSKSYLVAGESLDYSENYSGKTFC